MNDEVDILSADRHKRFLQIDTIILDVYGQIYPNYPKYLKKLVSDEVNFLHTDKHERFLQIDTMIFDGDKYS